MWIEPSKAEIKGKGWVRLGDKKQGSERKMIVFAQATHNARMEQTKECIRRINKYNTFDRKVIIVNESKYDKLSEENRKWLLNEGCEVYTRDWNDSFPEMRNAYLSKTQNGDWVVVADSDEWFCDDFCKDVRKIISEAEERGLGLLLINSHDITYDETGEGEEKKSNFYKNLIFKKGPTTRYEAVGETNVHEKLVLDNNNTLRLDDKYYYLHVKYYYEVWERAARNVFCGGGGNNVGSRNKAWVELRKLTDELGIKTWPEFKHFIEKELVKELEQSRRLEPNLRLLSWIIKNRKEGFDYENEMCDFFRWFKYLHPRLVPEHIDVIPVSSTRAKIMAEVEKAYLDILGRHADTPGKETYTRLIEQGKLTIDQVRESLKKSYEYRAKQNDIEVINASDVKVDVNVHLDNETIKKIIFGSKTYKNVILKPWRLGRKWDAMLQIPRKVETGGKGTDTTTKRTMIPFIETFKKYCPSEKYNFVLDVGAGDGLETLLLKHAGYNVLGITFGVENIKKGKEAHGVELLEMDMHDLAFAPELFDAVFSVQTFEHTFSPWLHILELRRVLRDGGRVFIDVPDPDDQEMLDTIWHTSVLYPNQIKALFKKAGFKEVDDLSQKHRLGFIFEKIPDGEFEMWGYIKYIMKGLKEV